MNATVRTRLALAVLVATVLAYVPGALNGFALPKIACAAAGIVLAASVPGRGRLPKPLVWLLAAGGLWLIIAALAGASPTPALLGRYPRYEGLLAGSVYLGALWAGARLLAPPADGPTRPLGSSSRNRPASRGARRSAHPDPQLAAVYVTLAVSAILIGFVAALEAAGLRPIAGQTTERVGAFLGNATDMGAVGALTAIVLVGPLVLQRRSDTPRGPRTWLYGAGILAAVWTTVASGSRAAIGALVIGSVIATLGWFAVPGRRGPARPMVVVLPSIAAVTVAAASIVPAAAGRIFGDGYLASSTVSGRFLIWQRTLDLVRDHLWLGVGPSGYRDAILAYQDPEWVRRVGVDLPLDSPHNIVLQLLAAGGVPLLVIAVGACVVVARVVWSRLVLADPDERATLVTRVAGVLAVLAVLLTHLTSPGVLTITLLMLGSLCSVRRTDATTSTSTAREADRAASLTWRATSATDRVVAGVWALVGIAVCIIALFGSGAEVALRQARDAAVDAEPRADAHACETAARLRGWDRQVWSICAQNTAVAIENVSGEDAQQALAALAIQQATRALEVDPGDIGAREARAVGSQYVGDLESAQADLSAIDAQTCGYPRILLRLGTIQAYLGDSEGAVASFEKVLRIDPSNTDAADNLTIMKEAEASE